MPGADGAAAVGVEEFDGSDVVRAPVLGVVCIVGLAWRVSPVRLAVRALGGAMLLTQSPYGVKNYWRN